MHLYRGNAEEARKVLLAVRESHPAEARVWKALANLALRQGNVAASEAIMVEAETHLAGRVEWLLVRAERLASLPEAQALPELFRLESAALALPEDGRDRLERYLAEVCERQGNWAAVERLCGRILTRHPQDLRAERLLLEGKLAANDAGAERLVNRLRKLEGEDGVIWRAAGAAWRISQAKRGGRSGLAEARRLLEETHRRRPAWAHAAFLEGQLEDLEGNPEKALKSYRRVLQLGDYHPTAVLRVVQLLAAEGKYIDANQVLEVVQWEGALDRAVLRPAANIALRAASRRGRASWRGRL